MTDLSAFLSPKSVAVIGASPNTDILRGRIMKVLRCHDFSGAIYPVSRSHKNIMGLKAYPNIRSIPETVDLVVLIIPAKYVLATLEECADVNVRAALILSSGFSEDNTNEGDELQREIKTFAKRSGMLISGPNSEGYANMNAKLCPTFSPAVEGEQMKLIPEQSTGRMIAVIAQSGGMGFAFYDRGRAKELPFSYVVTTGNEACMESLDIVDHLIESNEADIFIIFMEDVKTPAKLARVAEKALMAGKPIIVTKIGKTTAGARAAASHTASLAGHYNIYQAIFRRYGIIEVSDIEEMVDIAAGFSYFGGRLPAGNRVGIFTASGGGGGWLADSCVTAGLTVPFLDPKSRKSIDQFLPSYGTSQNPVDGTAGVVRTVGYAPIIEMIADSKSIDSVIAIASTRLPDTLIKEKKQLAMLASSTSKAIFLWSYTLPHPESVRVLAQSGLPLFTNMQNCTRCLAAMANYQQIRNRWLGGPKSISQTDRPPPNLSTTLLRLPNTIFEYEAMKILTKINIKTLGGKLATNIEDAVLAAKTFGAPVALKVQSPDVLHKADVGGVILNLEGENAIRQGFETINKNVLSNKPGSKIVGTLVQPMSQTGLEMIVGISNKDGFGPILMAGFGGTGVETLQDVTFSPAPIDKIEAINMLNRLHGSRFLDDSKYDTEALVSLLVKLSKFSASTTNLISEIDLNPVIVHKPGAGVSIVDALIIQRNTS